MYKRSWSPKKLTYLLTAQRPVYNGIKIYLSVYKFIMYHKYIYNVLYLYFTVIKNYNNGLKMLKMILL